MKGGWKSTSMANGALCVITIGATMIQLLCVASWGMKRLKQSTKKRFSEKVWALFGMTTLSAQAVRPTSPSVPTMALELITVTTVKMQE